MDFNDGKTHTVVGFFVMSKLDINLGYVFATGNQRLLSLNYKAAWVLRTK